MYSRTVKVDGLLYLPLRQTANGFVWILGQVELSDSKPLFRELSSIASRRPLMTRIAQLIPE